MPQLQLSGVTIFVQSKNLTELIYKELKGTTVPVTKAKLDEYYKNILAE